MSLNKLLHWSLSAALILIFVSGCNTLAAEPTHAISTMTKTLPTATFIPQTATPTSIPVPDKTFLVMTYNVQDGGNVAEGGNTIDKLIEYIQEVQPDILGMQEGVLWAVHETGTGEVIAEQLGMNYTLAEAQSGHHVTLFTRYKILESEAYGESFTRAALRTKLQLPDESVINVFIVHIKTIPNQAPEIEAFNNIISPYADEATIVMGDFNRLPSGTAIEELGFELVATNPREHFPIDHIYVSDSVGFYGDGLRYVEELTPPWAGGTISDHQPVMVEIGFR